MGQTAQEALFQLTLSRSGAGLSKQLAEHIRALVRSGQLQLGDRLPASRTIAKELRLARGTVTEALETLIAEGILEAKQGAGTFIAVAPDVLAPNTPPQGTHRSAPLNPALTPDIDAPSDGLIDLRPCRPSVEDFPLQVWRRCMSLAASAPLSADYNEPQGSYRLRGIIADYLRRARGIKAGPDQMIITNGSVHAMNLFAAAYLNSKSTVNFEDPGYPLARQVFARSGARVVPCAVDEDGVDIDAFRSRRRGPELAYVTPSHQFPMGGRLSITRRKQLVEWAYAHNALIAEDDYDGEYRYDVSPLSPIYNLAPDRVVYFGTFSKTLFPDLRIGFAIAPKPIIERMTTIRTLLEYNGNQQIQHALANFIETGGFERHILKMRRVYARKRNVAFGRIKEEISSATLAGINSGLSFALEFKSATNVQRLQNELTRQGVLIPTIARYCIKPGNASNGLVFGFAEPPIERLHQGIDQLVAALTSISG